MSRAPKRSNQLQLNPSLQRKAAPRHTQGITVPRLDVSHGCKMISTVGMEPRQPKHQSPNYEHVGASIVSHQWPILASIAEPWTSSDRACPRRHPWTSLQSFHGNFSSLWASLYDIQKQMDVFPEAKDVQPRQSKRAVKWGGPSMTSIETCRQVTCSSFVTIPCDLLRTEVAGQYYNTTGYACYPAPQVDFVLGVRGECR